MSTITGTINNGITLTGSYASPLTITSTGAVATDSSIYQTVYGNTTGDILNNQGRITSAGTNNGWIAVNLKGTNSTVINSGTIRGPDPVAIQLNNGGSISNSSTGYLGGCLSV